MKNTVKKILALVFAVVMVCSLAVPALAADDTFKVQVTIIGRDGEPVVAESKAMAADKATVEAALDSVKDANGNKYVTIDNSGAVTKFFGKKLNDASIIGEFGTGTVVVTVNGVPQTGDLGDVKLTEEDQVIVYWADTTLETKLAFA
jgi:hypothetical protein